MKRAKHRPLRPIRYPHHAKRLVSQVAGSIPGLQQGALGRFMVAMALRDAAAKAPVKVSVDEGPALVITEAEGEAVLLSAMLDLGKDIAERAVAQASEGRSKRARR
jgi:hypothetical protein